jgi:hypothetical protein
MRKSICRIDLSHRQIQIICRIDLSHRHVACTLTRRPSGGGRQVENPKEVQRTHLCSTITSVLYSAYSTQSGQSVRYGSVTVRDVVERWNQYPVSVLIHQRPSRIPTCFFFNTLDKLNDARPSLGSQPIDSSNRNALGALEVLGRLDGVSVHGLGAGPPAGRAHLAVLVGELEGLDQAEDLVRVAADGEVVDGDLAEDALGGDDEAAAERHAGIGALLRGERDDKKVSGGGERTTTTGGADEQVI